ncbi:CCR4-Not complex component Not1 family protein [Babesia bovis T2Bo]|uniref:Uncharacterized protein n=1 Tax=Babesia bovis TaxID=5865 RepID=A7AU93_BABBO|nr:CCR4-Not complex component Not1 family protein [Babesia bovis T2Bo]EDO06504.1 CCR4-Not complex component Not1 family protein [Babesia bovis T2Bo]|eukprot:XP_001610072.1 hypothetical protein [Babesia bovis T2Bo]
MTHVAHKSQLLHTGQPRHYVKSQTVIQAKERLRAISPSSRQAAIRRILEEAPDRITCKEFIRSLDEIYTELSQDAGINGDTAVPAAEIAEPLLSAIAPTGRDINSVAALIYVVAYTCHEGFRTYTERRLFPYVLDVDLDVRQFARLGCARLLVMVLLSTTNIFVGAQGPQCERRVNVAAAVAAELLARDEEAPLPPRKEKNDVFNYVVNMKMEAKNMKRLLNKSQWDALCTDLRIYAAFPPQKLMSKFVNNLKRICDYVAFNSETESLGDYATLITSTFLNSRFQVELLLNFIESNSSHHHIQPKHTRRKELFERLIPIRCHEYINTVLWAFDTDVLCMLFSLVQQKHQVIQFKTMMEQLVKDGSQPENCYLLAKAMIYALTDLWIRDHDPFGNRDDIVKLRLANTNPLFWYTYELCLQQFISSEDLINEIRSISGGSIQGKRSNELFEFLGEMAKSLPGEYIILGIMETMRYVQYNIHVVSFMINLFQGILMDVFKDTKMNFSKGLLEIVCYCRQTFDWGFMTMLIHSVDALMVPEDGIANRNDVAKEKLAGGFMDYLRWKMQQIRQSISQGNVTPNVFIPNCNVIAEIFCILNHTIGPCDELLDIFQAFVSEYKGLGHYKVLLIPLYDALKARAKGDTQRSPKVPIGFDRDLYSYMVHNEDIQSTTSHIVDIIFSCKLHQSVFDAVASLNADKNSLRTQTILDVLMRKYINRLVMVLNLSVPNDFCLHVNKNTSEETIGLGTRLAMVAQFTGKLLSLHLMTAHCDSVYIIFRILIEAIRSTQVFLIEFAVEAFSAMGNLLAFPVFAKVFINEDVIARLYPQFASHVKAALERIDVYIVEVCNNDSGAVVFEKPQCLKAFDSKARGSKGLMILKQSTTLPYEFDPDHEGAMMHPNNASTVFSIVNLAANIQYKQLPQDTVWYQDQLTMDLSNLTLDDLLGTLKVEFEAPPNALEIMSIMEMTLSNKTFTNHVEQLVTKGYVDWLLFVIYRYVLIRGYTYFRDCIVFMATLGGARMMDAMVKFAAYCLNVFLKYLRVCRSNPIYRKLLTVSSGWMGAITLGRNKPLLTKHLDLKHLILYSYQNGYLTVIIPAVCKLLMNVKSSKIFRLPNPWTSSLLNLLADIATSSGLKSTLQFDLSLLFRNLELIPGPRLVNALVKEVPVSDVDRSPKLGSSIWSTCAPPNAPGAQMMPPEFQIQPVTQEVRELLKRKIVLNPKVSCLNAKWPWIEMILNAIESCYMESSELIKKTMFTCITTTRNIMITDFSGCKRDVVDNNPEMLKISATAMASGLATSLIMATSRDQLCSLMALRLHMQILSVLSMEPVPGHSALTNNLEQVSGFLAKDNLGLVCALVEQATLELITGYVSASINDWIASIGKEPYANVPTELSIALQSNMGLDTYNRFGALVPFAMTRLQADKHQGSPPHGFGMPGGYGIPQGGMMNDSVSMMHHTKPRQNAPAFRLPDFMVIPPIDNLPTSLIACKIEEFEHRVKEAAKQILTHPPTVPLLNSKYLYSADSSTLLLLSCLPRNHALFTLLWSMDYMLQHAASQPECIEAIVGKVLKTSKETSKGLDVVSIVQEVEYCLLEMLSVGTPLVVDIITNVMPSLGPARLCQFVRHGLIKLPALDRYISGAMDLETCCRTMHKLVLDTQWVTAADLPISMSKLASMDPNATVQIQIGNSPVSIEFGELHRRLSTRIPMMPFSGDSDGRNNMGHVPPSTEHTLGYVPPGGGYPVQGAVGRPGNRNIPDVRLRTMRQLVVDKSLVRNKMVIKLCELPGKERYIKMFQEFLVNADKDSSQLYQNFNEHPPDAFLTCTLLCALQMTFEPMGTEMKSDRLPQTSHNSPVWHYCDGWSVMAARLSRSETFMLHKALHVMLGVMQHGLVLICFERILSNLINELESNPLFLVSLANFLTLCGPSEIPEFGEYWISLVTRKQFLHQVIQSPNEWPLYHHLLVEALTSSHSKNPSISFVLVTLMQKVPEFLCGYYLSLCDVVPPRAMQLRNLLTCAVPRSFKLPNPIIVTEHVEIPSLNFTNHIITVLKASGLKVATDMFIHEPNEGLVPVILKELRLTDPSTFDVVLANHYVLYLVNTLPIIRKKMPGGHQYAQNSLLLLEKVITSCISQARHMLLSCMTNHLRYPNTSTFSFVSFMIRLFVNCEPPMQEQITLALLERLLISRPHPWGVLHLLFQLVENPKYDFWNRIEAAPEVEKHIRRIIQGCLTPKAPPQPGAPNEHVR